MALAVLDTGEELSLNMSRKLNLPLETTPREYFLVFEKNQWVVRDFRQGKNFVIRIDFDEEIRKMQLQKLNPKKDLFARALGMAGQDDFHVLDGTFGVGKDAVHLICCGAQVIGYEKNPITFTLIESALQNSSQAKAHLQVHCGDVEESFEKWKNVAQALYLDPMFENVSKKSAPKKSLVFLREIAPIETENVQGVISKALDLGIKRVVVKRPLKAAQLYDKPQQVLHGKLIRYDVYSR